MMQSVLNWLDVGGPVVWLLFGLSVIALMVVLVKAFQFLVSQPIRVNSTYDPTRLSEQSCQSVRAQVFNAALAQLQSGKLSAEQSMVDAQRHAREKLADLNSHLRILEVIAMMAPLLGLFGTVLGMIEAFQAMEAAGRDVNPSVLSGGIWVALLTTAVGLAVAIPVSVVNSLFERLVENQAIAMSNDLETLHTQWALLRE